MWASLALDGGLSLGGIIGIMNTSLTTWALAASLAGANALQAQLPPDVAPGARVRVHLTGMPVDNVVGTVTARDSASLTVRALDQAATNRTGSLTYKEVPIGQANIAALDISRGRHSNAGKGAVIGGSILGGLGLVLGVAAMAEGCNPNEFCIEYTAGDVAAITVITGALGAGTGALIGALSHSDRWERVLPAGTARLSPILRPSPDMPERTEIGIALRF